MRQFFSFFAYGFLPGLYHLLYMLSLPIAVVIVAWGDSYNFTGLLFFLLGAPLFRGLRNKSVNEKEIRLVRRMEKGFEKQATKEGQDLIQFNKDYPIQVLVFPYVSELNDNLDENGKLIVNELTERWVRLCFDEEYNFQVWQFSPELNIVMEQTGAILIPFHDIATMWGRHISEQKKNTGELNLHTLPNTVITGSKFLVVGPDSKYYLAGNNEEE